MALRTIVKDGDPILKKVCRPVTKFDDRLATLLDDMQDTLVDADGLGLAGPQVGMMRRIFICLDDRNRPEDAPADYKDTFIEFINPEIEYLSDETAELCEGAQQRSTATTAPLPAPQKSRSRHRTATATGLNWKPKTCWPAASSTRTTT